MPPVLFQFSKIKVWFISAALVFFPLAAFAATTNLTVTVNSLCGNGVIDSGEQCDGSNLNNQSCATKGFSGGTLSCNSNCTFNTSSCTAAAQQQQSQPQSPGGGGGGGGGGGIFAPSPTEVILKGGAPPGAIVNVLQDGLLVSTLKADAKGDFQAEVNVAGGLYTFMLYAVDPAGVRSLSISFTTNAPSGLTTAISDILIPSTITADKSEVKAGNDIKFSGYTYPQSQTKIVVNSAEPIVGQTNSDQSGFWQYILNSGNLEKGDHTAKAQTIASDNLTSAFSESLGFRVGDADVPFGKLAPAAPSCNKNGDINNDKRVNIIDFSILLFFWGQHSPQNPCADINKDGVVNLFDFSIMLFWWTG